jgi:general secretion pathway protein F
MPDYEFLAVDRRGRRSRSSEHSPDAASLIRTLESRGLLAIDVREREQAQPAIRPVRASAVADAVRSLASLLASGLPLARALDVAATAAPRALADALRDIRARLERGDSVATACAAHPRVFNAAAVGILRAGERAGDLDGAFDRLANQLERAAELRARLVSALIYPAVLAVAGGAALLVLLLFVLPRFAALLEGTGIPLPASAALLLAVATGLRANWPAVPLLAVGIAALAAWLRGSDRGRRAWAGFLLTLPLVRTSRRDALTASAARTLAVLLRGGAPLSTALDDAAHAAGDPILADALRAARARVVAGVSLRDAVASERVFSETFVALVATGEEAGRLAEFLDRAGTMFEQRTLRSAQRLIALAEPAMVVGFGIVIAGVALSLLQAIYGLNPTAPQ